MLANTAMVSERSSLQRTNLYIHDTWCMSINNKYMHEYNLPGARIRRMLTVVAPCVCVSVSVWRGLRVPVNLKAMSPGV